MLFIATSADQGSDYDVWERFTLVSITVFVYGSDTVVYNVTRVNSNQLLGSELLYSRPSVTPAPQLDDRSTEPHLRSKCCR